MKALICCFFLGFSHFAASQVLLVRVFDLDGGIIPFADIYINRELKAETSRFGTFHLQVQSTDTVRILHPGFEKAEFYVQAAKKTDTLRHDFFLAPKIRELAEVTISEPGIKKVFGEKNEHILDYFPMQQDDFYVLKKRGDTYLVSYETGQRRVNELRLYFKPDELFRDFLGNIHILSADSSYQLFFDDSIQLMQAYSRKTFESQLRPVVGSGKNALYTRRFSTHNQRYYLDYKSREEDLKNILMIRDSISEVVAQTEYNLLIGLYYFSVPEIENIILNGTWDGDVNKLINSVTAAQLTWYSKIRSQPLNIQSFERPHEIITVDLNSCALYSIDKKTNRVTQRKIELQTKKKPVMVYDYTAQKLYCYVLKEGEVMLYYLDLGSASITQLGKIKGVGFSEKMKISNGWMYFIAPYNQYDKVYRIRLPG